MESTAEKLDHLRDFTTTTRVVPIAMLALIIGAAAAYVAWALLNLIGLCTNLFFFQRFDTALASPAGHHLGPLVILSLTDLLTARTRILDAEQRRERVLGARLRWPGRPSAA